MSVRIIHFKNVDEAAGFIKGVEFANSTNLRVRGRPVFDGLAQKWVVTLEDRRWK
jgi:hypothetical protein